MKQQLVFSNVCMCFRFCREKFYQPCLWVSLGWDQSSIPEASGSRMEGGGCGSHGVVSRLSLIPTVSFWVFSPESHRFLIVPSVISDLGSVCLDNKPLSWRLGQIEEGDWEPLSILFVLDHQPLFHAVSHLPFSGEPPIDSRVETCRTGLLVDPLWASFMSGITSYMSASHPSVRWMFCLFSSLLLYFFCPFKKMTILLSFQLVFWWEVLLACGLSAMFSSKFILFCQGNVKW